MLLAGDVGGTKTNLALFTEEQGAHDPIVQAKFVSADYENIGAMLQAFIEQNNIDTVECVALGVPGPVIKGRVLLMNDLVATASAIPILHGDDIVCVNEGEIIDGGPIAVIAPGTGLGEAYLTAESGQYIAHPSEGGHCNFSPSDKFEMGLLSFLFETHRHVSTERVCSGLGIPNIYDYLKSIDFAPESAEFAAELEAAPDRTPVIMNNAALGDDAHPLCTKTLQVFASILGSEAGDLALSLMATGGVYLGGGIPPRIVETLKKEHFRIGFENKGRFSQMMTNTPVYVILNPEAALLGAARVGLERLL